MKLIKEAPPKIQNITELKDYLKLAIKIEFATIPSYLAAMYSIKPGFNKEVSEIIRTIVVEEMLHMVLVANVLNAIGGKVEIYDSKFVPEYPLLLPVKDSKTQKNITLNIQKLSPEAISTFLEIEGSISRRVLRNQVPRNDSFNSIAELYKTISDGLIFFNSTNENLFCGDKKNQITQEYYYNSGGKVVVVDDIKSALNALDLVIEQSHDETASNNEMSHYERFYEILNGPKINKNNFFEDSYVVNWEEVYNMIDNPSEKYYINNLSLIEKSNKFNVLYRDFLKLLNKAFNGQVEKLRECNILMFKLREEALELIKIPIDQNINAGPSFKFLE